jgi:hypothetical protein
MMPGSAPAASREDPSIQIAAPIHHIHMWRLIRLAELITGTGTAHGKWK